MDGDPGSGGRALAIGRGCLDGPYYFMAQHQWLSQDRFACRSVKPVVEVGSADPAVGDLDDGFIRPGLSHVHGVKPQVVHPVYNKG